MSTNLKALAAEYRPSMTPEVLHAWAKEAAAILEQVAGADAGCPVVAWLLLDQGCRAPDDCEDFERVELASELPAAELERFKRGGRATALISIPDHLAALTAQSGEGVALYEALLGVVRVADRKTDEFDAARAAIAAYEAKRGGVR